MATDNVETSSYHVKKALDANFTFAPGDQPEKPASRGGDSEERSSEEDDDADEPDIGTGQSGFVDY